MIILLKQTLSGNISRELKYVFSAGFAISLITPLGPELLKRGASLSDREAANDLPARILSFTAARTSQIIGGFEITCSIISQEFS